MQIISGSGDDEISFEEKGDNIIVRLTIVRTSDKPVTDKDLKVLESTAEFMEIIHENCVIKRTVDVFIDEAIR